MPRPNRPRPIPPDPDGFNDRRSIAAARAINIFIDTTNTDREDALADLLCNLKHWCDRNGMSFGRELERASRMYKEETMAPPTPPD